MESFSFPSSLSSFLSTLSSSFFKIIRVFIAKKRKKKDSAAAEPRSYRKGSPSALRGSEPSFHLLSPECEMVHWVEEVSLLTRLLSSKRLKSN